MFVVIESVQTPSGTNTLAAPPPPNTTSIPHFDVPFRYVGTAPVVNEQDSIEDISAQVYAVLVTPPGTRDEMPDFGFEDPAFSQLPLSAVQIAAQVSQWVPDVHVLVTTAPDALDATIANANIQIEATS